MKVNRSTLSALCKINLRSTFALKLYHFNSNCITPVSCRGLCGRLLKENNSLGHARCCSAEWTDLNGALRRKNSGKKFCRKILSPHLLPHNLQNRSQSWRYNRQKQLFRRNNAAGTHFRLLSWKIYPIPKRNAEFTQILFLI